MFAPDFIDTYSNDALSLTKQRDALLVVSQGVITIVGGQDGVPPHDTVTFFADVEASLLR